MTNVFFHGSGTWFNKDDGSLLYPLIDKTHQSFCFPPVHLIDGIFSITDEDAKIYKHTHNLDHVKKLFPNTQPDSAFLKMVNNGIFLNDDINLCYLKLPRKKQNKSRFKRINPILVIANEKINTKPSSETKKKTATKVLKRRILEKNQLTDLIYDFLASIDVYPDCPKPFGSGIAWRKLILEYKNENNLIKPIPKDGRSIILNSIEKEEINKPLFGKRYNAQFVKKDCK